MKVCFCCGGGDGGALSHPFFVVGEGPDGHGGRGEGHAVPMQTKPIPLHPKLPTSLCQSHDGVGVVVIVVVVVVVVVVVCR